MELVYGWLAVGVFVGIALTLTAFVMGNVCRQMCLSPPDTTNAIPLSHQQGFRRT